MATARKTGHGNRRRRQKRRLGGRREEGRGRKWAAREDVVVVERERCEVKLGRALEQVRVVGRCCVAAVGRLSRRERRRHASRAMARALISDPK